MSCEFENIYFLIDSKTAKTEALVEKFKTYNYNTVLNETLTDIYELSLVDYQINLPTDFDKSGKNPFILLKVNDFELVKHNKVPKIFKTIPSKKPSDTNICHHSTLKLANQQCNISHIHIQICDLNGNFIEKIDPTPPTPPPQSDSPESKSLHNSFLFRAKRRIVRRQ